MYNPIIYWKTWKLMHRPNITSRELQVCNFFYNPRKKIIRHRAPDNQEK